MLMSVVVAMTTWLTTPRESPTAFFGTACYRGESIVREKKTMLSFEYKYLFRVHLTPNCGLTVFSTGMPVVFVV